MCGAFVLSLVLHVVAKLRLWREVVKSNPPRHFLLMLTWFARIWGPLFATLDDGVSQGTSSLRRSAALCRESLRESVTLLRKIEHTAAQVRRVLVSAMFIVTMVGMMVVAVVIVLYPWSISKK